MNQLEIHLANCYGIKSLSHTFSFAADKSRRSYAIYAPNGLMKSSFAKTFERLGNGQQPEEPRFNTTPTCTVKVDDLPIEKESIFVLKDEIDTKGEISAVTNLLVQPEEKARYDALVVDLEKQKQKAINALQKISGIKKAEIEKQLADDFGVPTFVEGVGKGLETASQQNLAPFKYSTLFSNKALEVIRSRDFQSKAAEFNQRYDELFQLDQTIYKKGVFNPARAGNAFGSLQKERFFEAGHRVHLDGDTEALGQAQLEERLHSLHARIDGDESLKKIRENLAKTAETRELNELLESLDAHQFEHLASMMKPENQQEFRRELWRFYLSEKAEAKAYLEEYDRISEEIAAIEGRAASLVPEWHLAIGRFNQRFINMPFTLRIANEVDASLGKTPARLLFAFENEVGDSIEGGKEEAMKTLSRGERRALHLLTFIFEVESRKKSRRSTLFIADDPADSFDYKNKHAIVQYLEDITNVDHFRQIILTHNFDLFRTLARFVHRDHCLVTVRCGGNSIALQKMEGVNNIFTGIWKPRIMRSDNILIATIPFVRNLIEYTRGEGDAEYLKLTSLLHWKEDSICISIDDYLNIYNLFFGTTHVHAQGTTPVYTLLMEKAEGISTAENRNELQLEKKIVLSIAARILAERYMTEHLRTLKSDRDYWYQGNNQFGNLLCELKALDASNAKLEVLECIGVTVSSNIHLNSFMYEPLLDLPLDHLICLFDQIKPIGENKNLFQKHFTAS